MVLIYKLTHTTNPPDQIIITQPYTVKSNSAVYKIQHTLSDNYSQHTHTHTQVR